MDDITFVRSHWWLVSEGFSLSTANSRLPTNRVVQATAAGLRGTPGIWSEASDMGTS